MMVRIHYYEIKIRNNIVNICFYLFAQWNCLHKKKNEQ